MRSIQLKQVVLVASYTLMLCVSAHAATLSNYQHRVSSAARVIEQLAGAYEDESFTEPARIQSGLTSVRETLPAKEEVEMGGQRISVDNSWLHDALAEYEKTSSQTKRAEILTRAAERLRAIEERLKEIDGAKPAASDKDANKGRLAEILRRPEYIQTAPESSALDRLLDRFFRWLGRLFPKAKPIQPGGSPVVSGIAQLLVVGVSIAAIGFLVWRYGPRFIRGRKKKKKAKRGARIVLGEVLGEDQTAADLLAQAESLARNGDLRAAIRKAYIALLCELGDRKLISLAQHKTNRDYLNSVRDKGSLYSGMRKLTQSFELHWYGFVPAGETDWTEFRNGYQRIVRNNE
ncbi:MAG TPA: DUF4129 domain-containing protein [Pyrinomonadaceae bacterium]|nr:DUF4129 domain-containing protein [Pyrinomonadaceae bacterium]